MSDLRKRNERIAAKKLPCLIKQEITELTLYLSTLKHPRVVTCPCLNVCCGRSQKLCWAAQKISPYSVDACVHLRNNRRAVKLFMAIRTGEGDRRALQKKMNLLKIRMKRPVNEFVIHPEEIKARIDYLSQLK
jgi:hypothetical protein